MLGADLLADPSPFLWPILVLGVVLAAATLAKTFEVWIKRDHSAPGRGLGAILGLSGLILAAGFGGVLVDLYALAGVLEANPELTSTLTPGWLIRSAGLLAASLVVGLAGALAWFVLTQWHAFVSHARRELLELKETTPLPRKD